MAIKKSTAEQHEEVNWPYGKKNYISFGVALLVILIGFYTLSQGSDTLAPVLLVIGYMVLIPISLMLKDDVVEKQSQNSDITD